MVATSNLMWVIDTQNQIIRAQSDVIDELFSLLSQHLSAEEIRRLPAADKIREIVALREVTPGASYFDGQTDAVIGEFGKAKREGADDV